VAVVNVEVVRPLAFADGAHAALGGEQRRILVGSDPVRLEDALAVRRRLAFAFGAGDAPF
jgi:hypothetical protein